MTKQNNKKDKAIENAMKTHNEAEAAFWLSEWFGAIFYYYLNRRKIPFEELSDRKYLKRNVWTGWVIKIVLLAVGLGIAFSGLVLEKLKQFLKLMKYNFEFTS